MSTKKSIVPKDEILKLIDSLKDIYSKEELERIEETLEKLESRGKKKAKQIRPIVPIKEWLESEYYLGPFTYDLYPYWKEQIIKIFESPVPINEVILTGSTGSGKTSAATIIIIRKLYELSCYENISSLFPNLSSISRIAFAYLSVTATQAKTTGFSNIREMFDSIPYFRDQFPRKADIDSMLIWEQERLFITYGSVLNHFIGLDLLGAVLDEANYFAGRETVDTGVADTSNPIYLLYDQVVSRAHSRFVTKYGNDSLSVIASSATISSSFTEGRIKKGLEDPTVFIASPARWDVRPDLYGPDRFLVFAGSELVDPKIVDTLEDLNEILEPHKYELILSNISLDEAIELIPTDIRYKIVKVPEEHRSAFKSNIIYMLQDLAGYSVASSNRFFTSKNAYESCKDESLIHPFSKENVILSTTRESSQEGYLELMDYFLPTYEFKDPSAPRFMHLDLALTNDSAGIAMVHIDGWKRLNEQYEEQLEESPSSYFVGGTSKAFEAQLKVFNPNSGIQVHQNELKLPTVRVDFMLEIKPPNRPNKISFSKIRDFIIWLKYVKKVNIQLVTMDQFQSAQMQQELDDMGIPTAHLSVDRTPTPYRTLASLIQDHRISYYEYSKFNQELFALIETRSANNRVKIDHPHKGSKDISDAVAGATYSAVTATDKTDTTEESLVDVFIKSNVGDSDNYNIKSEIDLLMGILKKQ